MTEPKFKGITLISSDVLDDGRIVIARHCQDHTEHVIFDDQFELEMILQGLTDRLPKAPCPKCGMLMPPWYVKEYTCEQCNTTYSENYLEYYDEINAVKKEMEAIKDGQKGKVDTDQGDQP